MEKRNDRRDSQDEKEQKSIISQICKEIAKENKCIELNMEDFHIIGKGNGNGGKYFSRNGELTSVKIKRNHCKDSKAIDGVVYFRNKETNKYIDIYFYCKFTKSGGGDQDYIPFEVEITKGCIQKNTTDKLAVIFMLEGGYWRPSVIEDCDFDNEKTFYANRETMKKTLINILKTNQII